MRNFFFDCVCVSQCVYICVFFLKQENRGRKPCCVTRRVPQLCVWICIIDLSIFFVMSHAFLLFDGVLSAETARPVVWTDVVSYGCVCMCFSVLCDAQISINQSIESSIKKDHPNPIEKAALNIIHKLNDKACVVNVFALRDQEQKKKVKVQHIDTKLNVADCLTKPMTTQVIRQFMRV